MNIFKTIMSYLREQQTPAIRNFHITILILVLSQVIVSNFMDFTDAGDISSDALEFYGTWTHLVLGLLIIPLALIFFIVELKQRGFKYFYPYFSGEFSQLKDDLKQLMRFSLPGQNPYGIAAVVQGLGFGALFLVLFSGASWFTAWSLDFSWAHDIKEIHELFTGLIEAYLVGHGAMGLIHIFFNAK